MLEPPGRLGPQGPGAAFVLFSRAVKKRATRADGSALTLLVTQVLADHHDPAMTANHLALVADLLDARMNLHLPAVLIGLFVSGPRVRAVREKPVGVVTSVDFESLLDPVHRPRPNVQR